MNCISHTQLTLSSLTPKKDTQTSQPKHEQRLHII